MKRNKLGQFKKGNHVSTEFKKGAPPPRHKRGCRCFRCTRTSWLKGRKMSEYLVEEMRQRNLNMSESTKNKIRESVKKLWDNPEYRKRMSKAHKNQFQPREEKSKNWKGDSVRYRALHNWVERTLGKPATCEYCGKICTGRNTIHWANKTGKYLRRVNDWLRLCVKCHRKHDKFLNQRQLFRPT